MPSWLVFTFGTLLTQIMILNMLIAIMTDAYNKVEESRQAISLQEKILSICDYIEDVSDNEKNRFYAIVKLDNDTEINEDRWLGMVASIKKSLKQATRQIMEQLRFLHTYNQ